MDKDPEGYLRGKESQLHTRTPTRGSSARKISPHNFRLLKPVGIESVEENSGAPSKPSKRTHTQIYSELQHQGSSLKGTSGIQGGTEMSGIKARAEGQLSPKQKDGLMPLTLF